MLTGALGARRLAVAPVMLRAPRGFGHQRGIARGYRPVRHSQNVLEAHARVVTARHRFIENGPRGSIHSVQYARQRDAAPCKHRLDAVDHPHRPHHRIFHWLDQNTQAFGCQPARNEQLGAVDVAEPYLNSNPARQQKFGQLLRAVFLEIHAREIRENLPACDSFVPRLRIGQNPRTRAPSERNARNRGAHGRHSRGHLVRIHALASIAIAHMKMNRASARSDGFLRGNRKFPRCTWNRWMFSACTSAVQCRFNEHLQAFRSIAAASTPPWPGEDITPGEREIQVAERRPGLGQFAAESSALLKHFVSPRVPIVEHIVTLLPRCKWEAALWDAYTEGR